MWQFDKNNSLIPGRLPADGSKITALYARLSRDDGADGDSGSITNQRELLLKYALENHFSNIRFFCDDGYSGTNFNRPAYEEMINLVKQGHVSAIIVKDHSRLGRNRLKIGFLMEQLIEDYSVRYIAVSDSIDTARGLDDMVAVRELFNEFYPRDCSKKIRTVLANKGNSGERLTVYPPYGYKGNKQGWQVDESAAAIVREIFDLCIAGYGPLQIAHQFTSRHIPPPETYRAQQGLPVHNTPVYPDRWSSVTVSRILSRMEYTGCTVNFKTTKKSYKSKKIISNPPEKWKIFPNTHPAIIDRDIFDRVQELRQHKRRTTKSGYRSMFSGLLYCADCGGKLYLTVNPAEHEKSYFYCSNYRRNTCTCTAHYIREVAIRNIVLQNMREVLGFAREYEDEFTRSLLDQNQREAHKALSQKKQELEQAQNRFEELDTLFQRLYEDNVSGKISDARFKKLSDKYEDEQQELKVRIGKCSAALEQEHENTVNVDRFLALVRKYTRIEELTPELLNLFIKKIVIHAPDKSSGKRTQKVDIYYNFIGETPEITSKSE